MSIVVKLDEVLKQKGMTAKELCALIGITEANMSILRSGKAKAIRFDTLNKLCFYLKCEPKDILFYEGDAR
jgi:putative transcriptional regulator